MIARPLRTAALAAAIASGAIAAGVFGAAQAQETLRYAQCYDLSRAYTFVSPQVVQGARDLRDLINLRGGIEGRMVEVVTEDHGNEPQRGIECYERLRRDGIFVFDFLSTPVVNAIIPRGLKDEMVIMQSLVGRGDTIDGSVFKWNFPVGPTYWGQAANNIAYIKGLHGGDLTGKKIAFVYLDYPFGQEPINVLRTLAEREGFELQLFPVPLPGNDQAAVWSQMRRANPDHIVAWLLANGHVVASREMRRNGIPMEKYISVNWLNEVDIRNIGTDAAKGLKRGTNVAGGQDVPIIREIITELYDKGKGNGPREAINDVYYNTGVAMASVVFEGMRQALKVGNGQFTPETMRAGLHNIKAFDANGLFAPVTVTPEDHGGGGRTRIEMWDGTTWVPQTDWISAYEDVIWEVVRRYSAQFAAENK